MVVMDRPMGSFGSDPMVFHATVNCYEDTISACLPRVRGSHPRLDVHVKAPRSTRPPTAYRPNPRC